MTVAVLEAWLAGTLAALAVGDIMAARRGVSSRTSGRPVRLARVAAGLAHVGRRAGLPLPVAADLDARLRAAGVPDSVSAADAMAVKAGGALAGGLGVLLPALAAPGRLGGVLLIAGPGVGFLLPDQWLRRRTRSRSAVLALEVADVLDLLRVTIAAGLSPDRALHEVGLRRGGLLGAELTTTAQRIALGVPRAQAYARLRARCAIPEAAALVSALQRADRHGTPLAPALGALALEARAQRARLLQERAARAAPKIQLVVALLLVPAVMLIVAGALISALTSGGG